MNKYQPVLDRYLDTWKLDATMNRLTAAFNSSFATGSKIAEKGVAVRQSGKLSPKGVQDEMRDYARKEIVPVLRRASHSAQMMRGDVVNRKNGLQVPKPDKSDVAAAILRMEIRTWLKGLDQAGMASVLMDKDASETILQAAFEVPPQMIGAPATFMADLKERLLTIHHGPELEKIAELEEAITLTESMITLVTMDVQQELGFDERDPRAFADWYKDASAPVVAQLEKETPPARIVEPSQPAATAPWTFDAKAFDQTFEAILKTSQAA